MEGIVPNFSMVIYKKARLGIVIWLLVNFISLALFGLVWLFVDSGTALTISAMVAIMVSQTFSAPWFDLIFIGNEGMGLTLMYISLCLLINMLIFSVLYSVFKDKVKRIT